MIYNRTPAFLLCALELLELTASSADADLDD